MTIFLGYIVLCMNCEISHFLVIIFDGVSINLRTGNQVWDMASKNKILL